MLPTTIKVSDLLMQTGKKDSVDFSGIILEGLEGLVNEGGISGSLALQSIPDGIIASFSDLTAHCTLTSDLSGKQFDYVVSVPSYTIRFRADFDSNSEYAYDEEFPLESKNQTIDIALPLEQMIRLQLPIVALAPGEEIDGTDEY